MKKYILLLFAFTLVSCHQHKKNTDLGIDKMGGDFVVKNISVITMENGEALKNRDIIITKGVIKAIIATQEIEYKSSTIIIDGTGKFLMPSLSDAHVHFPETEQEMEHVMRLYLINGVTKLRSMRGDWKHSKWRENFENASSIYPKLYISPPAIGRSYERTNIQTNEFVKSAKEKGFDFVKILSVKNEETFNAFASSTKKYDLPIGGHFPGNVSDRLIFESNYTSFEHVSGLTDPKLLNARLSSIKGKNISLCPTLSWYNTGSGRYSLEELRALPGMEFIPKKTVDDWIEKTKQYREKIGEDAYKAEVEKALKSLDEKIIVIREAHNLGINIILSPDSSSKFMVPGFSVVGEMHLLKKTQLSNFEILKMATTNFASLFKGAYGTIKVGNKADFILLNQNPLEDLNALEKVEALYFDGKFLNSGELNEMRLKLLEIAQN